MKRAIVSITSNIAEGFSRKSILEKKHFFYLAKGSLTEIQNQLLIAKDVYYIDQVKYDEINEKSISVGKLINSLLKYMESGKFVPHI